MDPCELNQCDVLLCQPTLSVVSPTLPVVPGYVCPEASPDATFQVPFVLPVGETTANVYVHPTNIGVNSVRSLCSDSPGTTFYVPFVVVRRPAMFARTHQPRTVVLAGRTLRSDRVPAYVGGVHTNIAGRCTYTNGTYNFGPRTSVLLGGPPTLTAGYTVGLHYSR